LTWKNGIQNFDQHWEVNNLKKSKFSIILPASQLAREPASLP